ncbi:MAG: PEP-CTERM sorting domain-containing protein [Verrucomicrobia bacterium]|nr:PEP-CTERM sorting domain-containing protein [Verrucomicrobiota bacterium]
MKKLLLTLGLIGCTLASAVAQGTIAFGNSVGRRIMVSYQGAEPRLATAADGLTFGLFYGPAGSTEDQLVVPFVTATIGDTPGVLAGAPSVLALPSTEPGQVVSIQVRIVTPMPQRIINPPVKQVTLGQTAGPGAVIYSAPGDTTYYIIPEPGTIAVAGLAGLLCGIVRWRRR